MKRYRFNELQVGNIIDFVNRDAAYEVVAITKEAPIWVDDDEDDNPIYEESEYIEYVDAVECVYNDEEQEFVKLDQSPTVISWNDVKYMSDWEVVIS